jgi:hypothetical protein
MQSNDQEKQRQVRDAFVNTFTNRLLPYLRCYVRRNTYGKIVIGGVELTAKLCQTDTGEEIHLNLAGQAPGFGAPVQFIVDLRRQGIRHINAAKNPHTITREARLLRRFTATLSRLSDASTALSIRS